MTLPASGRISLTDIRTELGKVAGTSISLNDADVRALAGKTSGAISLSDFYGKSKIVAGVVNSSLGLSETAYTNIFQSSAACQFYLEVSGHDHISSDTLVDGSWATGTVNDSAYEVRYTVISSSTLGVTRTIYNGASNWTAITSNAGSIVFEVRAHLASTTSTQSVDCTATFLVEIRAVGSTTPLISQTLKFTATASPINVG